MQNFSPSMEKCMFTGSSSNIQDGARLDIVTNGFWGGRFECTFFGVQVFDPHAPSNRNSQCDRKNKLKNKRQYKKRVREVEHASFTPLVLSATGGMANKDTVFYKRLASYLATKWDQPYSSTLFWLQCRLTFSLPHSAIQCIRGAIPAVNMAISELNFVWTPLLVTLTLYQEYFLLFVFCFCLSFWL